MGKVWVVQAMGLCVCVLAETRWHAIQVAMWEKGLYKVSKNVGDYKVK